MIDISHADYNVNTKCSIWYIRLLSHITKIEYNFYHFITIITIKKYVICKWCVCAIIEDFIALAPSTLNNVAKVCVPV